MSKAIKTLLLCVLLCGTKSAFSIHLCTDLQGKKVYQDQPCANNPSTSKIVPVKAQAVTEENARETVKRYGAALSARDPAAAFALVSLDLEADVLYNGEIRKVNTERYKEFMHQALIAVDKFEVQRECELGKDKDRPRDVVLVCKVNTHAKSNSNQASRKSTETMRFAVERGEIKIKVIRVTDF